MKIFAALDVGDKAMHVCGWTAKAQFYGAPNKLKYPRPVEASADQPVA
jgi:hypothetical protein